MKKLFIFTLVLTLLGTGFSYSIAHAQTAADLAGATIGVKDPDQTRSGLATKLTDASTKLAEGKYLDAIDKLVDFRVSVEKLAAAPKPKISQADAQLLIADANNAIACIQSLTAGG